MPKEKRLVYEFGEFRLDRLSRQLWYREQPMPLTSKCFDLLVLLVQSHGEVLSKEHLIRTLWPDTFVEEGNLTQNISVVRKILAVDPSGERCIETVPRRGYRFSAPVREADETIEEDLTIAAGTDSQAEKIAGSRRTWHVALGVFAVGLLGVALWALWARSRQPSTGVHSLAVLPFINLGQTKDDYISDGLTEEIINEVALIPGLKVVARTSAFQFKGKNLDVRSIGSSLGADMIMEGSVRTNGTHLRVTAQLNSARDGYHYWSRTWEHDMKDVFLVEQEIAREVTEVVAQGSAIGAPHVKPLTQSVEAHDYYLQGRQFKLKINEGLLSEAVAAFENALREDPNFAAAHAQISQASIWSLESGKISAGQALPVIKQHARLAAELDPDLALGQAVQADVSFFTDWDFAEAERSFRRALELNPSDAGARHEFAHYLLAMGRFKEAEAEAWRAADTDPLNPEVVGHIQFHFNSVRDYPRAIVASRRTLAISPTFSYGLIYLQQSYEGIGQFQNAVDTAAKRPDLDQGAAALLRSAYEAEGGPGYWKALHEIKMRGLLDEGARAWEMAVYCLRVGRPQEGLRYLKKAVDLHQVNAVYLKIDSEFDSVREHPEFRQLIRRIGLPAN
jgi:TolB-like protein/DNA-binding winged helix-turn-helix (wHTH) protein